MTEEMAFILGAKAYKLGAEADEAPHTFSRVLKEVWEDGWWTAFTEDDSDNEEYD